MFIAACVAADILASFVGVYVEPLFPSSSLQFDSSAPQDIPLPVFFIAGFIGALVVVGAARFLFGPQNISHQDTQYSSLYLIWQTGLHSLSAY